MANFQIIFSGNEDELYRFVITWKMMTDSRKYEEQVKQLENIQERINEAREELKKLEIKKRELNREISELMSLREALRKEVATLRGETFNPQSGEAAP